MKQRDLIKRLENGGYHKERDIGDHTIYEKLGHRSISVPRHREINERTARQILRDAGL